MLCHGTKLNGVQWTPHIMETWIKTLCWPMGYNTYKHQQAQELRNCIHGAVHHLQNRAVASCGINHTLSCCTLLVAYDVKQLSPTLVLTAGVGILVAFSLHVIPQCFASRIYGGAYALVIDDLCTTSDLFTHAIDIFLITIIAYHPLPDLAFSPALAS
ncbi:hypothetical protein C8R48DRAFT_780463 [Suillus tomentosus]|nr:hypothetical protein C8R48DRAFT_780463 [Suillus tomentosus]